MSKITSHVLDTSAGKPAQGVKIFLYKFTHELEWIEIADGITNEDGRLTGLLKDEIMPEKGIYKLTFNTGNYFSEKNIKRFHPHVEIVFEIDSAEHYHIPLLISPFGYTTYKGS